MGIERNRRMDRDSAERLLGGDPAASGDLAELLVAAATPAPAGVVAGEDAAMAAFRAARGEPLRHPHRSMLRPTAARLLVAKIAALVVVVLGAGGVAVAATTGELPSLLRMRPATAPGTGGTAGHPRPAPSPTPPSSGRPGQSPTDPEKTADLHGLCTAYAAGQNHLLDTPAFDRLIAAAGGVPRVAAYCSALLTSPSAGTTAPEPASPAPPSHSTGKPGTTPANGHGTHPTHPPSSHPGGTPSSHPEH
jgi:hypothetical protein